MELQLILMIIGAACIGHLAADLLNGFEKLPSKPFKCNMCMTYWLNLVPFIFIYGGYGFFYLAIASILSELIYKQLTK